MKERAKSTNRCWLASAAWRSSNTHACIGPKFRRSSHHLKGLLSLTVGEKTPIRNSSSLQSSHKWWSVRKPISCLYHVHPRYSRKILTIFLIRCNALEVIDTPILTLNHNWTIRQHATIAPFSCRPLRSILNVMQTTIQSAIMTWLTNTTFKSTSRNKSNTKNLTCTASACRHNKRNLTKWKTCLLKICVKAWNSQKNTLVLRRQKTNRQLEANCLQITIRRIETSQKRLRDRFR